jgi:hypothetical protein
VPAWTFRSGPRTVIFMRVSLRPAVPDGTSAVPAAPVISRPADSPVHRWHARVRALTAAVILAPVSVGVPATAAHADEIDPAPDRCWAKPGFTAIAGSFDGEVGCRRYLIPYLITEQKLVLRSEVPAGMVAATRVSDYGPLPDFGDFTLVNWPVWFPMRTDHAVLSYPDTARIDLLIAGGWGTPDQDPTSPPATLNPAPSNTATTPPTVPPTDSPTPAPPAGSPTAGPSPTVTASPPGSTAPGARLPVTVSGLTPVTVNRGKRVTRTVTFASGGKPVKGVKVEVMVRVPATSPSFKTYVTDRSGRITVPVTAGRRAGAGRMTVKVAGTRTTVAFSGGADVIVK